MEIKEYFNLMSDSFTRYIKLTYMLGIPACPTLVFCALLARPPHNRPGYNARDFVPSRVEVIETFPVEENIASHMCTYPVCNKLSSESVQCGKGESSFATLASRGDSDAVYDVESVQHTAFHHIEYRAEYVHEQ